MMCGVCLLDVIKECGGDSYIIIMKIEFEDYFVFLVLGV